MIENLLIQNCIGHLSQQRAKVVTREVPIEGIGGAHEESLEVADALAHRLEVREVVWGEGLPLQDREVDFNLVEPAGMDGEHDPGRIGKLIAESLGERGGTVRTTLIHDPEYPTCGRVGFSGHDVSDKTIKRGLSVGCFDTPRDLRSVHIQGSQVGPGSTSFVFMFDPLTPPVGPDLGRMKSDSGLNARLLICRDHVFVRTKTPPLPKPLVKVQDRGRPLEKERIPRPDPRPTPPGLEGIGIENSPDRGPTDRLDVLLGDHDPLNIRHVQAAQRLVMLSRQFAGNAFDDRDDPRGKKPAADPIAGGPRARSLSSPSVAATSARIVRARPKPGPLRDWRCPDEPPGVPPASPAELGRKGRSCDEGVFAPVDVPGNKRPAEIRGLVRAWFSSLKGFAIRTLYRQNHAKPYTNL